MRAQIMTAIAVVAITAAGAFAQQPRQAQPIPRGTSTIGGNVFDAVTRDPVANCQLDVRGSGFLTTVRTGADGAYELKDIAAGEYFFQITCPEHLMNCFPSEPAPTRAEADAALRRTCLVDVTRDQQRSGVNFFVTPGAVARGRVVAFDGRPVADATVRLGRGMRGEASPSAKSVKTDAEGHFDLINAPAGEWRLEVEIAPVPGGLPTPIIYYPGLLSWENAAGVELTAGKVTDDLVITLPRVNENVLTVAVPADAAFSDVAVSVVQQTPFVTRRLALDAEGVGTLNGIVPGRYFAVALASAGGRQMAGFEVVDFVDDRYDARLQLLPTGSIAGKIIVERGAAPDFDGVMVGASWVHDGVDIIPNGSPEAKVGGDGSFRIDGLYGTRQLQVRALGTEWEVTAIRLGRNDVTDTGIIVVPGTSMEATIVVRRR
jgi:hypothetical protein